jgi:hypothetical protein
LQAQKATATKSSASSSAAALAPQQNLPNKILFVENLPVEVTGQQSPQHARHPLAFHLVSRRMSPPALLIDGVPFLAVELIIPFFEA